MQYSGWLAPTRRRTTLRPETLEQRIAFSVAPFVDNAIAHYDWADSNIGQIAGNPVEEFQLSSNDADTASILLKNQSEFRTQFTLTFNGNISVNLAHLVQQIRDFDVPGQPDMPDYERAYHYLLKNHSHDFPATTRTWAHEPSLYLNSLGSGLCDDAASALSLIWNGMGYESRVWLLSGHVVSEVFTGERWQMYDADLQVVYYNANQQVAGVEELAADRNLIVSPFNRVSDNNSVYSGRMALRYTSVEDNRICTGCASNTVGRNLVFELPAGGTMEWGQLALDKPLPSKYLASPEGISLIKITVPADSKDGSFDIPLALYDIRGGAEDSVSIAGRNIPLGTDAAFDFFNVDSAAGNRLHEVSYSDNAEPIELYYLFSSEFSTVKSSNTIQINQITPNSASLVASIVDSTMAQSWDFVSDSEAIAIDASEESVSELFDGKSAFEVKATIKIEANAGTRRPVADAFRFAVEVDEQDRLYAYYRASNGWIKIRGPELESDSWHDVSVTYDHGLMVMTLNGQVVASRFAAPIDNSYQQRGLYIGRSDHMGGLQFEGEIENVTVQRINSRIGVRQLIRSTQIAAKV